MDVIQELEHLHKLAKEDLTRRFNRLYRLLRQEQFLMLARDRIAHNKGVNTPGVDGQSLTDLKDEDISRLSQELAAQTYHPRPVRRTYIPKANSSKLRPLGIPTSRDKIIQSGVALILTALYEPLFHPCSHGFRPGHSTITALRQINTAYRAGATWTIEGDISNCFGNIPHSVILNCLRQRIRDERFIDLIRQMLQAGVMEEGRYTPTYSGTPQGGICSPILANVVLHELDSWLETEWGANPPQQTSTERNQRSNPEYMRLHYRINDLRRYLDGKRPIPKHTTPDQLRQELRQKLYLRRRQPRSLPRRAIYYVRYADDFALMLCHTSKAEAQQLKEAITAWLQTNLGLPLNQEKTLITHWRDKWQFLGYCLQGRPNRTGSKWLHLSIPRPAIRQIVAKIKRTTAYPQAPAYDVFANINAITRGWTNYYRYAHTSYSTGGKLSQVIFWRTAHYLAKKHRCSIAKIVRRHYDRSPLTGWKALFIQKPGQPSTPEYRYFIWHKPPDRLSVLAGRLPAIEDRTAYVNTDWAKGRSQHKKLETKAAEQRCQTCGSTTGPFIIHHPNRLVKAKRVKKGYGHVAQSGLAQQTKLLCRPCHLAHHHHDFRQ